MELSKLQKEIVEAPYDKVIVMSSAASGKTAILTEKTRQLLQANVNPREIAVITFTNMAAETLRERLGKDYKAGLFIGTIHSLANYMLSVAGIDTSNVLDDEKFDELFKLVEQNPHCVKHLEWILLDEAQDSDKGQFSFIFDMIKPDRFFLVGDLKQCIYRWNGANPGLLRKMARQKDVKVFNLDENYRNGSQILSFAKKLISYSGLKDESRSIRKEPGTVIKLRYTLPTISRYIKENPDYKNWAILVRFNNQADPVIRWLMSEKIPYDSFKQGELDKAELQKRMNDNTVKVLTIHSAKGLEWDNVIVIGAGRWGEEEHSVSYVAATRARNKLIWLEHNEDYKKKDKIKIFNWE